jgi:hypothetical protein
MRGPDVRALKRALKKSKHGKGIVLTNTFGKAVYADLRAFQRQHGLRVDGVLGQVTFAKLLPYVDAYGRKLFKKAPHESEADKTFNKLFAAMKLMSDHTPGYQLGGGHGVPLPLNPYRASDCSSSCSNVLFLAGLLDRNYSLLSWDFLAWGLPGNGTHFTVETNGYAGHNSHVWIRLHKTRYWRFDTSPHGDGGRGPKLRMLPRLSWGFHPRHAKGL